MSLKSLFSGSAIYLLANLASAGLPFLLLPILTRQLGPAEYGSVAMFQALVSGLGAVVGLGVVGAVARKYYDTDSSVSEMRDFIGTCLQITFVSALLTLCAVVAFQAYLEQWLGLDVRWAFVAVGVAAATALVQIRLSHWQVQGKAVQYGVLQTGQSALAMLLSLGAVLVLTLGAGGRMWAIAASMGLAATVAAWLLRKDGLWRLRLWNPAYVRQALAFGLPLVPHTLGGFLLFSADRFIINAKLGLSDAGFYAVAAQLTGVMGMVFGAVNNAYVPWLFQRLKDNVPAQKRQIVLYTYVWFGLILLAVAAVFMVGPAVVVFVAGDDFEKAGSIVGWLALSQGFVGMYLMVTNYIFYSKRTVYLAVATLVSGLINLALLPYMVVAVGLKGAAWAACVANGLQFLLTWWLAARLHSMPWFGLGLEKKHD